MYLIHRKLVHFRSLTPDHLYVTVFFAHTEPLGHATWDSPRFNYTFGQSQNIFQQMFHLCLCLIGQYNMCLMFEKMTRNAWRFTSLNQNCIDKSMIFVLRLCAYFSLFKLQSLNVHLPPLFFLSAHIRKSNLKMAGSRKTYLLVTRNRTQDRAAMSRLC